jgi:hypothetical protein
MWWQHAKEGELPFRAAYLPFQRGCSILQCSQFVLKAIHCTERSTSVIERIIHEI